MVDDQRGELSSKASSPGKPDGLSTDLGTSQAVSATDIEPGYIIGDVISHGATTVCPEPPLGPLRNERARGRWATDGKCRHDGRGTAGSHLTDARSPGSRLNSEDETAARIIDLIRKSGHVYGTMSLACAGTCGVRRSAIDGSGGSDMFLGCRTLAIS